MVLLIAAAFASCFLLDGSRRLALTAIIAFYFALNVAYCLRLKHYSIIDVFVISFGFVLRLAAGDSAMLRLAKHPVWVRGDNKPSS